MAAKAIVAERRSIALDKIRKHAAVLSETLGVDATALTEDVKGDAAYQEMIRTEQLSELLAAVREKVGKKPEPAVTRSPEIVRPEVHTEPAKQSKARKHRDSE